MENMHNLLKSLQKAKRAIEKELGNLPVANQYWGELDFMCTEIEAFELKVSEFIANNTKES